MTLPSRFAVIVIVLTFLSLGFTGCDFIEELLGVAEYKLEVQIEGKGKVSRNPDLEKYAQNTKVILEATPEQGWSFSRWSGDTSGNTNPLTVTMNSAKSITAVFIQDSYTLSATSAGSGSVSKSPDQASYLSGSTVELTATADSGWNFSHWNGDASGSENPLSVTMGSAKTITAVFSQNSYVLGIETTGNGSVSKSPDQASYLSGSVVELTAMADSGWSFSNWSGDASGNTNPLSITMDSSVSIVAVFIQDSHSLNGPEGSIWIENHTLTVINITDDDTPVESITKEIRANSGDWVEFDSSYNMADFSLEEGLHQVDVRLTDAYENSNIITRNYDNERPDGEFVRENYLLSLQYMSDNVTEEGNLLKEINIDGAGWQEYTGQFNISGLDLGERTIEARITDEAGNERLISETVNITAPTETATFDLDTYDVSIDASSDFGVEDVQYRIDGGSWMDYTGTFNVYLRSLGWHTLEVLVTDSGGRQNTPLVYDFEVIDETAPTSLPNIDGSDYTVSGTDDHDAAQDLTHEFNVNGTGWQAYSSSVDLSALGLPIGENEIVSRTSDLSGNISDEVSKLYYVTGQGTWDITSNSAEPYQAYRDPDSTADWTVTDTTVARGITSTEWYLDGDLIGTGSYVEIDADWYGSQKELRRVLKAGVYEVSVKSAHLTPLNRDPYGVTGPTGVTDFDDASFYINLTILQQDGRDDPDEGDIVSLVAGIGMPSAYMSFGQENRRIFVDQCPEGEYTFDVWTEDDKGGTSFDNPHTMTVTIYQGLPF